MMNKFDFENNISKNKNYLIDLSNENDNSEDLLYLTNNFCGIVVRSISEVPNTQNSIRLYVIGDVEEVKNDTRAIFIIKGLSSNYEDINKENFSIIGLGLVPINIHNTGVYYRQFFDSNDFFTKIKSEHEFQSLTESK